MAKRIQSSKAAQCLKLPGTLPRVTIPASNHFTTVTQLKVAWCVHLIYEEDYGKIKIAEYRSGGWKIGQQLTYTSNSSCHYKETIIIKKC